jgi:hypothetical protein
MAGLGSSMTELLISKQHRAIGHANGWKNKPSLHGFFTKARSPDRLMVGTSATNGKLLY